MAHYDQQEAARPSGFFVAIVVIVALGIPILIIASLAFGLQPTLSKGGPGGAAGAVVIIPQGVGTDQSLNFDPARITVVVGVNNTVTWQQNDPIPHTVTSKVRGGVESFDSGYLNKGDSYSFTFNVPGTYLYECSLHPAWMKGTIIVKAK